jgi:hypothetical protein
MSVWIARWRSSWDLNEYGVREMCLAVTTLTAQAICSLYG